MTDKQGSPQKAVADNHFFLEKMSADSSCTIIPHFPEE